MLRVVASTSGHRSIALEGAAAAAALLVPLVAPPTAVETHLVSVSEYVAPPPAVAHDDAESIRRLGALLHQLHGLEPPLEGDVCVQLVQRDAAPLFIALPPAARLLGFVSAARLETLVPGLVLVRTAGVVGSPCTLELMSLLERLTGDYLLALAREVTLRTDVPARARCPACLSPGPLGVRVRVAGDERVYCVCPHCELCAPPSGVQRRSRLGSLRSALLRVHGRARPTQRLRAATALEQSPPERNEAATAADFTRVNREMASYDAALVRAGLVLTTDILRAFASRLHGPRPPSLDELRLLLPSVDELRALVEAVERMA